MKTFTVVFCCSAAILLCGCKIIQPIESPSGHYFLNQQVNFASVGRTVVLELENNSPYMELGQEMTLLLAEGLVKKHLFTVSCIYRSDPLWQNLDLDAAGEFSQQQLEDVRKQLGADAIVFGKITCYTSFPHLLAGVHLKMMDLRDGKLLWAIEELWDSTDLDVEQRMRRYFRQNMREGYEPINWNLLTISPHHFKKFVVYEITRTLPEVQGEMNFKQSSEKNRIFTKMSELLFKN